MKILHIISSFGAGGAENYAKNLLFGLKRIGFELCLYGLDPAPVSNVACVGFQRRFIAELEASGIGWGLIGTKARRNPMWAIQKFRTVVHAENPDLIHTHLTYAAIYTCLATRSKPIVFTHHNTPVRNPTVHKLFLGRRLSRYIAISESSRSALLDEAKIRLDQVTTIFNGVDLSVFHANGPIRQTPDAVSLIAVGSMTVQKNYPLMLTAMARLIETCRRESITPPILKIVGDGPERSRLHNLNRELGLSSHVEFLGLRSDVPQLLLEADLYCMSSSWEGLSIALIEALAAGLPIVATDVGGNREIVEDGVCGFLSKPGDTEDLAAKLWRLVGNSELRALFARQTKARAERFSIERSVNEHAAVYRDLVRCARPK